MKVALIYNPDDYKLRPDSYSQSYRQMLLVLIKYLETEPGVSVEKIHRSTPAHAIDADVIIFFDIHSSHHIEIEGIEKHPSLKYEYFDDPHQQEVQGRYSDGTPVHKLGARSRCHRALNRTIDFIISPYKEAFFRFLSPHLCGMGRKMLFHFPIAPNINLFKNRHFPFHAREQSILANGSLNCWGDLYRFRRQVFAHPKVKLVQHHLRNPTTIAGVSYADEMLRWYAAGLALAAWFPVPKYFEMPLAGCVTFMQWNWDIYELGFRDYENCIYIDESNFDERIRDFLAHPMDYCDIAKRGMDWVEHHYTAQHFAAALYNHINLNLLK